MKKVKHYTRAEDLIGVVYFNSAFFFKATLVAYGSSQARGQIGAAAAGLCHSLHLQPMPQLAAVPDP